MLSTQKNYALRELNLPNFVLYVLTVNLEDCHSCAVGLKLISDNLIPSLFSGYAVVPEKLCKTSWYFINHIFSC